MIPLSEVSLALLDELRRLGDEYDPLDVALAAAQLVPRDCFLWELNR